MPKKTIGGLTFYYHIGGEGEPLVLIQGVTMDVSYWIKQIPEFQEKYKLVVFDNRGVGLSDSPEPPYSTRQMADDLAGLLDAIDIPRAHILGFALGGCIAQQFAINYPGRVKSLILAATSACPAVEAPRAMYIGNNILKLAQAGVPAETRTAVLVPWVLTRKFFDNPMDVKMVLKLTKAVPRVQTAQGLAGQIDAGVSHDTRKQLGDIKAPTLVMAAKNDLVIPADISERLAAAIPGAELEILPEGGHLFFYEDSEGFNQAVFDFLARTT